MRKFIVFLILTMLIFTSCSDSRSAEDTLFSISKELDSLPYGNIYLKSSKEGEDSFLNRDTITTLYSESANEYEFTLIEDFAIYLCTKVPCEIAVFKCFSSSDTDVIAAMCLKRIDMLCILLEETPYKDIPKNAKVSISGKFVTVLMA